jgi:hypothetical protein
VGLIAEGARVVLASIWLFAVPKEPLGVVLVNPMTALAVSCCIWSHAPRPIATVVIAIAWDLAMGAWLMFGVLNSSQRRLLNGLRNMADCTYATISLADVMTPAQKERLEGASLYTHMEAKGLPYQLERDVKIFRIQIGDSGTMPDGIGAFHHPFWGSTIFIRDDPREADARERFRFWHEVCHSLGTEFAQGSMFAKGSTGANVALILATLAAVRSMQGLLACAVCLASLGAITVLLRRHERAFGLRKELRADEMALQFLSADERQILFDDPAKVLATDPQLSASENRLRIANLEAIGRTGESIGDDVDQGAVSVLLETFFPAISLLGWMIVLARYVRPPDGAALYWWAALLGVLVVGSIRRYSAFRRSSHMNELFLNGDVCFAGGRYQARQPAK